jgi:hypothetical protein
MVVEYKTTCAVSAYHHYSCEFESRSWRGVLDTTICDKVCQWLVTGLWFLWILRFPPPKIKTIVLLRADYYHVLIRTTTWFAWSWSYRSWIYNYVCNQCLSPLTLWVGTPFMARCTWYIMCQSLSVTCDRSVVFSGISLLIRPFD